METTKINYKSDFDIILHIKDHEGIDKGFPSFDWIAKFYTTSKATAYTAAFINGKYINCFNDDGQIHIVFNDQKMGAGKLNVEFKSSYPNTIYPDGHRDVYEPMPLDIELVTGAGEDSGTYDVDITIPFVYITAYEMAVRNGYSGTLEQYMEYVNKFPQVIEVNTAIHGIMSDLYVGKNAIADALTMQGKPTMGDEPMTDMASRILDLKLAVPGDTSIVYHERENGLYDLWTEMYNNQRGDYPYMYAISFSKSSAVLTGADAYLCSDGFFTTESGIHQWQNNDRAQKYVIFYFKEPVYSVIADVASMMFNICVFNGTPRINIFSKNFNAIDIYYQEEFINTSEIVALSYNSRMSRFSCGKMIELKGGFVANNCYAITEIALPQLNTISGGYIADNCGAITEIALPQLNTISGGYIAGICNALTEIALPQLNTISGGYIADRCYAITEIALPQLNTISGGFVAYFCTALTEIALPQLNTISGGYIAGNCGAITEIALPQLNTISGGFVAGSCVKLNKIDLPALKKFIYASNSGIFENGDRSVTCDIYMPQLEYADGAYIVYKTYTSTNFYNRVHLGAPVGGSIYLRNITGARPYFYLTVENGFKSYLRIDEFTGMTREYLNAIIENLADNNDGETISIVFGATNIAKLTEDDIAVATAKNYSLS